MAIKVLHITDGVDGLSQDAHMVQIKSLLTFTPSQNARVSVWLYEQLSIRIEGKIRVRLLARLLCIWRC
jgi:hypothetical protein